MATHAARRSSTSACAMRSPTSPTGTVVSATTTSPLVIAYRLPGLPGLIQTAVHERCANQVVLVLSAQVRYRLFVVSQRDHADSTTRSAGSRRRTPTRRLVHLLILSLAAIMFIDALV